MASEILNRELQLNVLTQLRDVYPDSAELGKLCDIDHRSTQINLFYLAEHRLIEPEPVSKTLGVPKQMRAAQITAAGLDFLEDDGGLGAILNVITIRVDAETLRTILETRIRTSELPDDQKDSIIAKLKSFSGDVLKALVIKLVEKGIEKPEQLISFVDLIAKFTP